MGHPLRPTHHRLEMAALVPANAETVARDSYGRSMVRVSPAGAANTALSFPATTEE